MEDSYCIKDKRLTPCVDPMGYQKDKKGRDVFFSKCGVCGTKKVRYVTTPIIVSNEESSEYEYEYENEIDYNFIKRL